MKILELFAGSCSFSRVAQEWGVKTFTSDVNKKLYNIDYYCDIMDFDYRINPPFIPDVIWASPDCSTWSKASGNLHYDSKRTLPKTEKAKEAMKHVEKTIEIIQYFLSLNTDVIYIIENPVGRMKNFLSGRLDCNVYTVDQCQYGREFQKATHLFTNLEGFTPKRCPGRQNGCNHLPNLKNAGQGKQGNHLPNGYYRRAMIAPDLCREIIQIIMRQEQY